MASKHTKSFKDSMSMASDLIHDFVCYPCQEDQLNTEAKYFCADCSKYYCDKCLTFHTKILKQHAVLGRKDVDKWEGHHGTLISCDLHPQEVIKLLCEDHAEMCCHLCVSLNHRMCRSISLISDLAKGVYNMADFTQLPSMVAKVTTSLNQVKEVRKKNQGSLKTCGKSMLRKITDLRKKLNQLLDELEKRTVEQMDSLLTDLDDTLQKDIDSCSNIHNLLKALLETIQAQGKKNESSVYIGFRKCEEKMEEANSLLQEMSTKPELTVTFLPDTRVTQLLSDMQTLGKIQGYRETQSGHQKSDKKSSEHIRPLPDKLRVFKVKKKSTFNVNIKPDTFTCDIMGITELPSGETVIVDNKNSSVKILNMKYKVIAHCDVPTKPQDICHVTGNQVAVAINCTNPVRHEVHFLNVSAGTIKITRKISVNHDCNSIRHHRDMLYV
ncbi:TRI33-like protein, partial [Mya arenaria]